MITDEKILALCQISELVYKPQEYFDTNFKEPFLDECSSFNYLSMKPKLFESNIDCQCYVSIMEDSILVGFRGTETSRDWLTDANIIRVDMDLEGISKKNRPKAHWGILRQFRSVEEKITEFINNQLINNPNIKNIIYTGHSLGGALAVIATQNYGHKYSDLNHMCVTFGAPRCGDNDFKKLFNKVCCFTRRYVNEYDPVASLPFTWRYTHVCPSKLIKGGKLINTETTVGRFFWTGWLQTLNFIGFSYNPVDDHGIKDYYNKLEKIFKNKV